MPESADAFGPRIRRLREQRGLSLRDVAASAGLAPSVLSNFERGRVSPTLATTHKILAAMGLTFAEFFGTYRDKPAARPQYVFAAEGIHEVRNAERLLRTLMPAGPEFACQMFYEEIAAGAHKEEMETHPHDLAGYVLAGELVFEILAAGAAEPSEAVVRAGDAFYIPAGLEHRAVNRTDRPVRVLSLFLGRGKPLY
jgi:transcriptional regulator with XRE-family HTH domain